jgi:deoxyadenosine/deoxycytidine kinase
MIWNEYVLFSIAISVCILIYYKCRQPKQAKKVLITVEGIIGVGKTTFVELLKNKMNTTVLYEPVDEWLSIKDANNKNILQVFYDDKKRWGYTFQNLAYITRMNHIVNALMNFKDKYLILDKSLESDINTFAKMLHNQHQINDMEWNIYNYWNTFFEKNYGHLYERKIIYLRCDAEIAYERIKKRSRIEEMNIELKYLNALSDANDEWIFNENVDCMIINVNDDFVGDMNKQNEILNDAIEFIYEKN